MADEGVSIPVEAIDKANATLETIEAHLAALHEKAEESKKDSDETTEKNKKTGFSFTELKSAIDLAAGFVKKITDYMSEYVQAGEEALKTDAKLDAVLRAQGDHVGASADKIGEWALQLGQANGIEEDYLKNAMAMAISFGGLSGEQIPRATQAAIDFGAVMGGDVNSNLVMMARVMETGVVPRSLGFSAALKQNIKDAVAAGDTDKALNLMLTEMENRFGGAAAKINDAGTKSNNLQNEWQRLKETIGASLVPELNKMNTATAKNISSFTDWIEHNRAMEEAMKELGYSTNREVARRDHLKLVTNQNRAAVEAEAQAIIDAKKAKDDMVVTNTAAGESEEQLAERIKKVSERMNDYIGLIGQFQSEEESYQDKASKLAEERNKLEEDRQQLISQGWWEGSEKIKDLDEKIAENDAAVQENANQHDIATKRIILNYLQQTLAADGLTQNEVRFLLQKGKEWGIYSDTVIQEAADAMAEVDAYKKKLDGIPDHISTMLEIQESLGGIASEKKYGKNKNMYAGGGEFTIPTEYGFEGFNLGGMATASAGEKVKIIPQGGSEKGDAALYQKVVQVLVTIQGGAILDAQATARQLAPALKKYMRSEGLA